MDGSNFGIAMLLAERGALHSRAFISTLEVARLTGFSQQSASRKLRELEKDGLIRREVSNRGIGASFTEKGRAELESVYLELKEVFSKRDGNGLSIKGKVVDGLGEGKYYTSLPQYAQQFKSLVGKKIFPGTLNLEVAPRDKVALASRLPFKISGFSTKERDFGGIDCWKCRLGGKEDALVILPHRSGHGRNILEIVAPFSVRKKFGLSNGFPLKVVVK